MRRREKEIHGKKAVERVIKKAKVCRVGFVDGKKPYVLPFNFGYSRGFFYLHCAAAGRKLDIIRRNNNVCVEIDYDHAYKNKGSREPCKYGFKYRSVVAEGKAEIIGEKAEKIRALKILMKHQTGRKFGNFSGESVSRTRIISIKTIKITGKQSGYLKTG